MKGPTRLAILVAMLFAAQPAHAQDSNYRPQGQQIPPQQAAQGNDGRLYPYQPAGAIWYFPQA